MEYFFCKNRYEHCVGHPARGGIIGGIVIGAIIGYNERRKENNFDHALALLCGLATVGILGWAAVSAFIY